jgi:hypothetical protein
MTTPQFIYAPRDEKHFRIAWYGSHSTQLHFEKRIVTFDDDNDFDVEWVDRDVRTLGGGIPTSVKDMLHEMQDFYAYCMDMKLELLHQELLETT